MFVHPVVHNDELLSRIAEHDIGFAGEMKYCQSRDLTVTNKIFTFCWPDWRSLQAIPPASRSLPSRRGSRLALSARQCSRSGGMSELPLLRSSDRLERSKQRLQRRRRRYVGSGGATALLDAVLGVTPEKLSSRPVCRTQLVGV